MAELIQSLHDESDALVARDFDALARAVERKDRALQDLAPQLRFAGADPFKYLVKHARELNVQNGRMLGSQMKVTRCRVDALLGTVGTGTLYAPDGLEIGAGADPRLAQRGVRA
jgi:hypothetical protein